MKKLKAFWTWLFNDYPLVEPPWTMKLAHLFIADHVPPGESFCVTSNVWRHTNRPPETSYQVSIFDGMKIPVQVSGANLEATARNAVSDYERHLQNKL